MHYKNLFILFILLLIFQNCSDENNEASEAYNKALVLWEKEKYKESLETLDFVLMNYPNLQISKKILLKRKKLIYEYKNNNNPYELKDDLRSLILQNKINNYYKTNGYYPENLNSLDLNNDIFEQCIYIKAYSNYGYLINCDDKNEFYLEDYERSINDIPINSFIAYYSTSNLQDNPFFSEKVDDINIIDMKSKFPKIKSKEFKTYWIGYINNTEETTKTVDINIRHASIKILLNGKHLYQGTNDIQFKMNLKEGLNKIEVFYENYSLNTLFSLKITDYNINFLNKKDLKKKFRKLNHIDYEPIVVSTYKSKDNNNFVGVTLKKSKKPIVLFLKSFYGLRWNIKNPFDNKIFAIVYSSVLPSSTLHGDIKDSIIIKTQDMDIGYNYTIECKCRNLSLNCKGTNFFTTSNYIENITFKKLTNFTGSYLDNNLLVPQYIANKTFLNKANTNFMEFNKQKNQCLNKYNLINKNKRNKFMVIKRH